MGTTPRFVRDAGLIVIDVLAQKAADAANLRMEINGRIGPIRFDATYGGIEILYVLMPKIS